MAKAILILGPAGISLHNCMEKYRKIISFLTKKYGPFKRERVTKDNIADDLVNQTVCAAINADVYMVDTDWELPDFILNASIVGEDGEFYIEIENLYLRNFSILQEDKKQEVLRDL